jgi:hypothetical protein
MPWGGTNRDAPFLPFRAGAGAPPRRASGEHERSAGPHSHFLNQAPRPAPFSPNRQAPPRNYDFLKERTTCNQKPRNRPRATEGSRPPSRRPSLRAREPAPPVVPARSFGRRHGALSYPRIGERRLPQNSRIPCARARLSFRMRRHTAPSARPHACAPTEKSTVCCGCPAAPLRHWPCPPVS